MKSNKMLWGGAGIIAAAVVVYFAFFYPSPQETDLQGAIGAVQKYQEEQIKPEDVVLAGETVSTGPDEAIVIEQISDLLGKATADKQAAFFRSAAPEKQLEIYARADSKMKAAVWAEMTAKEKVESFERAKQELSKAVLARVAKEEGWGKSASFEESWNAMSFDKQVASLEKNANFEEMALMLDRTPQKVMRATLGRIPDAKAAALLARATKYQRARLVAAGPEVERQALLAAMSKEDYDAMLGALSRNFTAAAFERAVKDSPSLLLAQATDVDKAVLWGRANIEKQLEVTGRRPAKENVAFMMAAAKPEELASLFGAALKPAEQVEVFEKSDQKLFRAVLERVAKEEGWGKSAIEENWNALTVDKKAHVLNASANVEELAALVGRSPERFRVAIWNKSARPTRVAWLGRIDEPTAASLYGHATLDEQFEMLGRAPEIHKSLIQRVEVSKATELMLNRTFVNEGF
jgi:hypothetical protein